MATGQPGSGLLSWVAQAAMPRGSRKEWMTFQAPKPALSEYSAGFLEANQQAHSQHHGEEAKVLPGRCSGVLDPIKCKAQWMEQQETQRLWAIAVAHSREHEWSTEAMELLATRVRLRYFYEKGWTASILVWAILSSFFFFFFFKSYSQLHLEHIWSSLQSGSEPENE